MALILGIDPGSRRTGWGIVDSEKAESSSSTKACLGFGVIDLTEDLPLSDRLGVLLESLQQIILQYRPHEMSVEKVFLAKNADSAFKLGHARGVAMAIAGQHKLAVGEYATRHVKKMLTGSGAASKEQVQFIVQHALNIKTDKLDATDALALALCHSRERVVLQTLKAAQRSQKMSVREGEL